MADKGQLFQGLTDQEIDCCQSGRNALKNKRRARIWKNSSDFYLINFH